MRTLETNIRELIEECAPNLKFETRLSNFGTNCWVSCGGKLHLYSAYVGSSTEKNKTTPREFVERVIYSIGAK